MKQLFFSDEHSGISSNELKQLHHQLMPEISRVATACSEGYTTEYAPLFLPFDTKMHRQVTALVTKKKALHPSILIVIGIGGSNLGTVAIEQVLQGLFYNESASIRFYCADSVDSSYTQSLYENAKKELIAGRAIMLAIISKSGTTTETIANAQLFTALLAQYKKNYKDYIVIISDEGSVLSKIAQKEDIACLSVPAHVGGRFSIFSPVGLFPLGILGIDTSALLKGAASVEKMIHAFDNNPAARSAAILYAQYKKGMVLHDSFFFIAAAEGIGRWYRQLLAESIGKMNDRQGKSVRIGITPTVSVGSVDLHSMVQLYLAGPRNRVTTFISVEEKNGMRVPSGTLFDQILPFMQGKSCGQLMAAILEGTKKAYIQEKLPFISIELPEISAYYIGQFMQLKMIEIIYLGALCNVNPFDQPAVELYKEETRKILAHD